MSVLCFTHFGVNRTKGYHYEMVNIWHSFGCLICNKVVTLQCTAGLASACVRIAL